MESHATYQIFGEREETTAAHVSQVLDIAPTNSHEIGDHVPGIMLPAEVSAWSIESARDIETGVELSEQIERLLAQLEPVASQLWNLIDEGYQMRWWCLNASTLLEHATVLDRALLARIIAVPGDLYIDVCGQVQDDEGVVDEHHA